MKKIIVTSMIAFFLLISIANAEMVSTGKVIINENEKYVSHFTSHQFYDDIEALSKLDSIFLDLKRRLYSGRTIDVLLYSDIQPLPYDAGLFVVDYCSWNITHIKTDYDSEGNLIGVSEENYSFSYSSTAPITTAEKVLIKTRNRDTILSDLRCYYNDTNYLYYESILFGKTTAYIPANKCNDCEDFTLEQLSNEIERSDEILAEETKIYDVIQEIIELNFRLWMIVSWLIRISLIVISVGLVFYGIYNLYSFLKSVEEQIR